MTAKAQGVSVFLMGILLAGLAVCPPAAAQESAFSTPVEPTESALQKRIEAVEEARGLSEEKRTRLLELYRQALRNVQEAASAEQDAGRFEQLRKAAPEKLGELRRELAEESPEVEVEVPDVPVSELRQYLTEAEAEAVAAREKSVALEADQKRRAERRTEIPKLEAEARQKLEEVEQKLAGEGPEEISPAAAADQTLLRARKRALESRLKAMRQELLSYDARGELLLARRDKAERELARVEKIAARWRQIVEERRRREAQQAAKEAAREATEVPEPLRNIAEENSELAVRRAEEIIPKIEDATGTLRRLESRVETLNGDFERVRERVEKSPGLTKALGLLLRKKSAELPRVADHRRHIHAREPKIAEVELELLELEERRAEMADLEARLDQVVDTLDGALSEERRQQLRTEARKLLESRLQLLQAITRDYDAYFDRLQELDTTERELIRTTEKFAAYIDEHILWFRSNRPLGVRDLLGLGSTLRWLVRPGAWGRTVTSLAGNVARRPVPYALLALAFLAVLFFRRRLNRVLERSGEMARDIETDSMAHTLRALLATVLVSAMRPLLPIGVGALMWSAVGATDFARAVGCGLFSAGVVLATIAFLRKLCRDGGLADLHFRWRTRPVTALRGALAWLRWFILPSVFLVAMLHFYEDPEREALGRIAFVFGMAVLAVFTQRILRRRGGVLEEVLARREGGWLDKLRFLWYPLAVAVPLGLGAAAGMGYSYGALVVSRRLLLTFWLLLAVLLLYELMRRWLFVTRRKLALEEARRRREAREEAEAEGEEPEEAPPPAEEAEMSIHSIGAQSQQLLTTLFGFALIAVVWLVWSDIIPALGVVGGAPLWRDITLGAAVVGLIIVLVTAVAAKNIPGLLEIVALQHLPLEPAVRFAITRICRYAITVVGIILAFGAVGVTWDKVQWLAAAVTVGLGFGLQEIFANFVSGLIILFERPMRVGDTVTVGDVTGTVSKIRIRATTITDWDRKELVVPNREFITGRLINWTLSDRILRVTVPVGIAYGSDTERAREILLRVARENSEVLDEPEPHVLFLEFGGSALLFELRVFVPSVEVRLRIQDELHMAIDRAFREAGIVIAFPQTDVHVRSIEEALTVRREQKEEG